MPVLFLAINGTFLLYKLIAEHRDHRGRGMENRKIQKSGRTRIKVSSKHDRTQTMAFAKTLST